MADGATKRNETKWKRNGRLRFRGDSSLERNRGEVGGFAVSSLFNCLAALSVRLGGNPGRRAPTDRTRGERQASAEHGGNSEGEESLYPEF